MMKSILALVVGLVSSMASAGELKTVDLATRQLLSVMLLPDTNEALVGLVNVRNQMAAFAICSMAGSRFEKCTINSSEQFPLTTDNMQRLRFLFEENLNSLGLTTYEWGLRAGVLNSLGLSPQSVAGFFGLQELELAQPSISEGVKSNYASLFNANVNTPRYVNFDAAGGALTVTKVLGSLTRAVRKLQKH